MTTTHAKADCLTGKQRFPARHWAVKFAQLFSQERAAGRLYAYYCPYCRGYHITSHKQRVQPCQPNNPLTN